MCAWIGGPPCLGWVLARRATSVRQARHNSPWLSEGSSPSAPFTALDAELLATTRRDTRAAQATVSAGSAACQGPGAGAPVIPKWTRSPASTRHASNVRQGSRISFGVQP